MTPFYALLAYCLRDRAIKRKLSLCVFALALAAGSPLSAAATDAPVILGFGDSLMAGYGLPQDASFPAQLESYLREEAGIDATVVNAGVSGDTSSGGRARLDWVLSSIAGGSPDLVILELGANDALRGIDPALTRANLEAMISSLQERGIPVLLAGMLAPPNMGSNYADDFNRIYPELAEKYGVAAFYPFFLDGVAAIETLNQDDGMHPTAEGIAIMTRRIAPYVLHALKETGAVADRGAAAEKGS